MDNLKRVELSKWNSDLYLMQSLCISTHTHMHLHGKLMQDQLRKITDPSLTSKNTV